MHVANPFKIIWTRDKVEDGPKLILVDTDANTLRGFYGEESEPRFDEKVEFPPLM